MRIGKIKIVNLMVMSNKLKIKKVNKMNNGNHKVMNRKNKHRLKKKSNNHKRKNQRLKHII